MGVAPLIVDAGDKSSHHSRVLRAAICETMENQAGSIIWCSLTFRKNPLRQFPSFSKLASFQMKSQEECEKARRMLYGQEQIIITQPARALALGLMKKYGAHQGSCHALCCSSLKLPTLDKYETRLNYFLPKCWTFLLG